jgi:tetratricopeptide (TPR) repeat protein
VFARPEVFVGRERELEQLVSWLRAARAPGVVIVGGEAGVGKSRLVAEAVDGLPGRVIWAACWEDEGTPAFWPWVQVIRACLTIPGGEAWRSADDVSVTEVLALLPEQHAGAPAADASRFRLFEGVTELVRCSAPSDGLTLVFDDLQWSDEASLRLLAFLVRSLQDEPVAVIGTYRDDEVGPDHPLRAVLGEMAGGARHLSLAGLEPGELATLAGVEMDGDRESAAFVTDLHRMTGGNPFFAREMLALLRGTMPRTETLRVPVGVRAVIERRLARVANRCEDVLKLAAVVGSPFALDDLAAVVGEPPDAVLGLLEEAIDADLVLLDPASPGHLGLAHDLLRETLYRSMAPLERARAHARVAAVLEGRGGEGTQVAALAHHLFEASPVLGPAPAVDAAVRAGDRALAVFAEEEAGEWYERALSLVRSGGFGVADELPVLLALGEARVRRGDLPAARSAYVEAANIARRADRPDDLARAALGLGAGLGGFEISLFDQTQIDLLEDALVAIGTDDSSRRAQVLARLSVALSFMAAEERRFELSREAVEMARRLGDQATLGYALAAHCDTISGPEWSEARRDAANEVVALGVSLRDRRLELLGRRLLIVALLELGDIGGVDDEIRMFASAAEALREPLYRWYVPLWRGMRALMAGDLDESSRHCDEAEALGKLAHSHNAAMLTFTQRWVRQRVAGDLAEAGRSLAGEGRDIFGDDLPGTSIFDALCHAHAGRIDEARATLAGLHRVLRELPHDAEWLATMAQAAEVAGAVGDRGTAALLDTLMGPFDHRVVVEGIGAAVYGTLGGFRAELARLLDRPDEAERLAKEATAAAVALGLRAPPKLASGIALAAAPGEAVAAESPGPQPRSGTMQREGDVWALTFDGTTARVRDSKGLQDLAALVTRPRTAVHVTELVSPDPAARAASTSRGAAVLDRRAVAEYRRRLDELDDDLAEADDHHDTGRAAKLREEREFLVAELSAGLGMGARTRRAGDDVDRARKAVRARIRDAIVRIEAVHPALGRHLDLAVRTGTYCSYEPETTVRWTVE